MRASASRFIYRFMRPSAVGVVEREVLLRVDDRLQPGLLFAPQTPGSGRPGWILLHGMTVPGRHHAGVFRFGRAFAAAGAVVVCPEIPEWTALQIDPRPVHATLVGAAAVLRERKDVEPDRLGAMAFSVAVPSTLAAAARSPLAELLSAIVGFGASCDLERTLRCMMLGEHEWDGRRYRLVPDPYGRWIVGANVLGDMPDDEWGSQEERLAVAAGLRRLAHTAGRNGAYSDAPVYDALKVQLRETLSRRGQELWDLFAPPSACLPADREATARVATAVAQTALELHPDLDARPSLDGVRSRVHLVHGYADQLVPFTETLRLASAFPPGRSVRTTITRLFGHARRELQGSGHPLPAHDYPAEVWRFLATLRAIAEAV